MFLVGPSSVPGRFLAGPWWVSFKFLVGSWQDLLPGILPAFCQLGIYLQKIVLSGSQLSQV